MRAVAAGEIDVVLNRAVSTLPPAAVLLTGLLRRGAGPPRRGRDRHHHDQPGRLSALTGTAITWPAFGRIPGAGCRPIASITRDRLSAGCWPIPLFPVSALARARRAYRLLSTATLALLLLASAAGVGALVAAPRRRRALVHLTVGGALTIQVASIVVSRLQSSLIARAQPRFQPATTSILQALTRGFFTLAGWCVIGSLVLATVALLSGLRSDRVPPPWGGGTGRGLGGIPSCGRVRAGDRPVASRP
ncbi:MAG: hypothetical protein ACRDRJ_21470 [Streptosporangiaceae bacterium]